MNSFTLAAAAAVSALVATTTVAGLATAPVGDDAINSTCPISGGPIDGTTFVEHAGKSIGFCCPGCPRQFTSWDAKRKDQFVQTALGAMSDESADKDEDADPKYKGDPYTLATCPVSGQTLGADAVVRMIDGREVRFCCGGCVGRLEESKEEHFKKIDEKIVKQQLPYYPVDTCIVMGDPLVEEGEDIAIDYVHGNRLFRLCCKGCIKQVRKDPAKYMKLLDEQVAKRQRPDYPVTTCVVGGSSLGSMGEPAEIVVGNRLVRFCCAGCEPAFRKEPAKYLTLIDNAWKTKK